MVLFFIFMGFAKFVHLKDNLKVIFPLLVSAKQWNILFAYNPLCVLSWLGDKIKSLSIFFSKYSIILFLKPASFTISFAGLKSENYFKRTAIHSVVNDVMVHQLNAFRGSVIVLFSPLESKVVNAYGEIQGE